MPFARVLVAFSFVRISIPREMEGEDEKARSPFQRSVGFYRNKTGRESDWEVTNVGDRVVVEKTKDDTQIWDGKGKPVGFLGYFDETLVETHTKRKEGDAPLGEKEGGVEKEPTGFLEYLDGPSLKAHLKLAGDHMRRAKESKRESTPVMSKIKKENKNDRCMSVDRDWRRESQGKEKMEDLMRLRRIAREFYESVTNHFHWFEPVMSDHSRELHNAFTVYLLPNVSPNNKKKMYLVTRFLVAITELLSLEGKCLGDRLERIGKIERVEDIDIEWIAKAETVWRSSQWAKIFHKIAQESNATIISSEVEALKGVIKDYLHYLNGTSDVLRKEILEKICYFLLEYLCTHSLDPCNLFVGSIPSKIAMESLFVSFENRERRSRKDNLPDLLEKGWREGRKYTRRRWEEEERKRQETQENKHSNQEMIMGDNEEHEETSTVESSKGGGNTQSGEQKDQKLEGEGKSEEVDSGKENKEQDGGKQIIEQERKTKKEHKDPLPPSRHFLQALVRWNLLRDYPNEVSKEIESLLSLLSPSVTCQVGGYVAVNVSLFQQNRKWFWNQEIDPKGSYKYVLFRLAEPLLSTDSVAQVFVDCFETKRATVPVTDLFFYQEGDSGISLGEEINCSSRFFSPPLVAYFQHLRRIINQEVANFIKENGAKHDPSCSAKLNYKGLEELCRDRMILENILASSSAIPKTIHALTEPIIKMGMFWASRIPPMLFPPPRLVGAFEEIFTFVNDLPSLIENEFQEYLSIILLRISTFKQRAADLKSGELKDAMCEWWLNHIETRVDQFLTDKGYAHDTLPEDYLNTPPSNMDSVLANATLLKNIIGEEGEKDGTYGVEKLVEEVVEEVYEKVDSLREEMEFMLEKKWVGLPLEIGWEEGGEQGDIELEEGGEIMKRDHEYLVRMKEMDEKIAEEKREGMTEKKKLELSDVVPVAGLVMARFHVHNCELSTVIEHWKTIEQSEISQEESKKQMLGEYSWGDSSYEDHSSTEMLIAKDLQQKEMAEGGWRDGKVAI